MILVFKCNYLNRRIQCYTYQKHIITQSHKHMPFFSKRATIGSMKVRDMILVPKSISTRARKFNNASRKNLYPHNQALHAPLHFLARI